MADEPINSISYENMEFFLSHLTVSARELSGDNNEYSARAGSLTGPGDKYETTDTDDKHVYGAFIVFVSRSTLIAAYAIKRR